MSIVDPCVLELLKHSDSRYTLVVEASKRGRQIVAGSHQSLPRFFGSSITDIF